MTSDRIDRTEEAEDAEEAEADRPVRASRDRADRGKAGLVRSSALMASGTLVSRILGLLRVALLAATLGTNSGAANAWATSNTLPNIIYLLLAGGMLNAILVPQLTRAMSHKDGGQHFTDRLLTLILIALGAITVVCLLAAAPLTRMYAGTWEGSQFSLAVIFAYLCMPQILFYGVYSVLGQVLNSRHRFGAFMWAPALANVVAILGLLVFLVRYPERPGVDSWTPDMVFTLAGTATLGVALQAVVLIPVVLSTGFRYRPRLGLRGIGLRTTSRMAGWTFLIVIASQVTVWFTTNLMNRVSFDAGDAVPGKFAFDNAFLIFMLPHSMLSLSLVTALYPRLSRAAHQLDQDGLREQFRHALGLLGVATVPIAVGGIVLAPAIAGTLFLGNSPAETRGIALITMAMLTGLTPYAWYLLSVRYFYAFENARVPFYFQLVITVISLGLSLTAMLVLPDEWVAVGIGGAQALGQLGAGAVGLIAVRAHVGRLGLGGVVLTYARLGVAALSAAVLTFGVLWLIERYYPADLVGATAQPVVTLLVCGPLFVAAFLLIGRRMRLPELAEVIDPPLARVRRLLRRG